MNYELFVSQEQLDNELSKAQDRLSNPISLDGWGEHEPIGRILRWMEDPAARIHLEKAASDFLTYYEGTRSHELIKVGNYYRLMENYETAIRYFNSAYVLAAKETGNLDDPNSIDYDHMQALIKVCFLLGRYEETIEYSRLFHMDDPNTDLTAYRYGQLAQAKLSKDLILAETVTEWTIRMIKRWREPIQSTGDVTIWDFYEMALEVIDEIKKNQLDSPVNENKGTGISNSRTFEDSAYLPATLKQNVRRKKRLVLDKEFLEQEQTTVEQIWGDDLGRWIYHANLGRVRRLLGQDDANTYLNRAAEILADEAETLPQPQHSYMFLQIGQLYRLAGQNERAQPFLQKAYQLLPREIGDPITGEINLEKPDELRYHYFTYFVITCFLLGHDEEAMMYGRFLHKNDVCSELYGYQIALLALAKIENDSSKAELVAQINVYTLQEEDDEWPPEVEGAWGLGNPFTTMDLYELALDTVAEIEADT